MVWGRRGARQWWFVIHGTPAFIYSLHPACLSLPLFAALVASVSFLREPCKYLCAQIEFDDDPSGDTTNVEDADMRVETRWVAGERCEARWEGAYAPATVVSDNGGFSSYTVRHDKY